MRVSIEPRYSLRGLTYAIRAGETTTFFRQSAGGWGFSEWTGEWIDGRSIQLQLPAFSAFATPRWTILLDGDPTCEGVLKQSFWPTRTSAIVWTCRDEEIACRIAYGLRSGLSMRRGDGLLLARWKFRCCSIHGAVRSSAGDDLAVAAVTMAFSMLLLSDD